MQAKRVRSLVVEPGEDGAYGIVTERFFYIVDLVHDVEISLSNVLPLVVS